MRASISDSVIFSPVGGAKGQPILITDKHTGRWICSHTGGLTHPVLTGQYAAQRPSLCRYPPCRTRGDPQRSPHTQPCLGCWRRSEAWAGNPRTLVSCLSCLNEIRGDGQVQAEEKKSGTIWTDLDCAWLCVLPSAEGLPSSLATSLLVGFCPRARMMSATWMKATLLSPTLSNRPKASL